MSLENGVCGDSQLIEREESGAARAGGSCTSTVTISSDNVPSFCFVSRFFKVGMSYLIKLPVRAAPSFINLLRGGVKERG